MGNYVITHADLMQFLKYQAVILLLPFFMLLLKPFVERLVDYLFVRLGLRSRIARRLHPRYVLDSYRIHSHRQTSKLANELYRSFEL